MQASVRTRLEGVPTRHFGLLCTCYARTLFVLACIFLLGTGYAQSLSVQAVSPALQALPRETLNLALQLENPTAAPWRGTPELTLPPGWRAVLSPGEVLLGPGERYLALFTVLVSANAEAGEYTLPVIFNSPAPETSYTVRVKAVRALETALLEAPPYVIAAPYTARFSVRNAGNRPEVVVLHTRDNLALAPSANPAQLQLAPGETAQVAVAAHVDPNLGQSQSHHLSLEARVRDDADISSRSSATVELIPRSLSAASSYHHFPLVMRLGNTLSETSLATADVVGGLKLSVSGVGQLWDEDPGQLELQLGVGSGRGSNQNRVSYETPAFQVAAGEQSFSLSSLTASRSGLGASAQHDFALGGVDQLELQALAYNTATDSGAGLRASAALGSHLEFGVYSLASSGPYGTVVGGSLKLLPELEGMSALNLATEYGLQTGTGAGGLRLEGEMRGNDAALSATWQQVAAGFQGAAQDSYIFSASSLLRLDSGSSTYLGARFNQQERYRPGTLLRGGPKRFERSWSARAATSLSDIGWSLRYEVVDGFDVAQSSTRAERELTFGVSAPLAADMLLTQDVSWVRKFGGVHEEALGYGVRAFVPLARGSFVPQAGGAYSLLNSELDTLSLGLGWSGLITDTDTLTLDVGGELELSEDRSVTFSTTGSYGFGGGQALEFDLSGRAYYSDQEPDLKLSLGYDIPLDVPLNRLSNVGEVKGRFEDESGTGLSGLIVQVAGLSVLTAENGSFAFPAVPEGNHLLVISDAGAMSDRVTVPALPHSVHLSAGETVEANFRVIRSAAIQGQVRLVQTEGDDDAPQTGPGNDVILGAGQPEQDAGLVANLVVELRKGESVLRARTDAEGNFEFRSLPPGPWQLTVVRGSLSELYRLEPEVQSLSMAPGKTARVEVDLIPVARSIQFMDGGVLSTP